MNDVIKLLPDSVANQIAAGEVIQQPSSVIKELVENAVDAGAKKIDIIIRDAGRTLIQVIDDGCGMTPTDARLAFERHSTSKIRQADDLFTLTTMGFRGEALASIAAISQLDVRTMPHDASMGTRLVINGSKVESQEPEITSPGTNFMVRNIFYNVPARRKFLKKDTVEFANILREFERLALVNPTVEMSLTHNDQLVHSLSRSNLKTRIGELFGRSVEDNIVPVNLKTDIITITGFVGNPSSARKRGALQYFFVNGRNMKHAYFRKAILNCYEPLITADSQPNFFINFSVNPASIDVNIHPTKNEIKFEDELAIWQLLSATVKEALGKYNFGPSINFDDPSPIVIDKSVEIPGELTLKPFPAQGANNIPVDRGYGGMSSTARWEKEKRELLNWEKLYSDEKNHLIDTSERNNFPQYVQVGGRYIMFPSKNGVMLVNQRRAHIRVLYNRFVDQLANNTFTSQTLLFPAIIELDSTQSMILENILDVLEEAGFKIEPAADNKWEIAAVPSVLEGNDGKDTVMDILASVAEDSFSPDDAMTLLRERVALSLARTMAIGYDKPLTDSEMDKIVSELFALPNPVYDPAGKKILVEITDEEIKERFKKE